MRLKAMKVHVAGISSTFIDWPDPISQAVIVFIAGCHHDCKGCQSLELKEESNFGAIDIDDLSNSLYDELILQRTNKLIFSGGDPLYRLEEVKYLIADLRNKVKDLQICIYTGFKYDEIKNQVSGLFDFIKTGMFDMNKRQQEGKTDFQIVLASTNQEFWDKNGNKLSENGIYKF